MKYKSKRFKTEENIRKCYVSAAQTVLFTLRSEEKKKENDWRNGYRKYLNIIK